MNLTALVLAIVFVAIATPFITRAKTETDPIQQRNKRLAGILFMLAGAAFMVAFTISVLNG